MGETTTTNESTQDGNKPTTETTSDGGDAFKPITSQDELNKALAERIKRERAKFSDYADLQAKAQKLDEFEAKAQADLEAANEATAAAEQRAADAELDALRWRVAVKHGISAEDVEMFLSGTDEDSLTRQAEIAPRVKQPSQQHRFE